MAQQTINATPPNSGAGDPLATGWAKTNANFTELYALQSKTLSAADPRFAGATNEASINNAINMPNIGAVATGTPRVYIPAFMVPFNGSLVTFSPLVQMVREGGSFDVYDLLAYGVTLGDQAVGATPGYNAAVAAAIAAGGGTVYFPPGNFYFMTSPTTLTGVANLTLQGSGRNASFLVQGADGVTVIGLGLNCTRVFIRDLWIGRFAGMPNGTTGGGFNATAAGYPLTPVSEILLDNVTFQNLPYPIYADNLAQSTFSNFRYLQTQAGATVGNVIYLIRSVSIRLARDLILTTTGTLPADALRVDSDCDTILCNQCEHVLLGNGATTAGFHAMDSVSGGNNPPRIIRWTDCLGENGQYGFWVEAARDCTIRGWEAANNNAYGVYVNGAAAKSVKIVNGQAFLNQQHGIYVPAAGGGTLIDGNVSSNNGQAANATYDGIAVAATDVRIVNNRSGDIFFTLANKQRSGLNLVAGSDHLVVGGNKLQGNLGNGFEQPILNASTGTNNQFFGSGFFTPSEAVLVAGLDTQSLQPVSIEVTLTAPRLVHKLFTPFKGQRAVFTFIQGGVGGFAVTWDSGYKVTWSDTGNVTGARSSIAFVYDGTTYNQESAQAPYV